MITVHPQFIMDANGEKSMVILPINEFDAIMEELEDMEDVRLYDEAQKDDDGERILFSEYIKNREVKNG